MYTLSSSSQPPQAAQSGGQFEKLGVWVPLALAVAGKCTHLQKDLQVTLLRVGWGGVGGLPATFFYREVMSNGREESWGLLKLPWWGVLTLPHSATTALGPPWHAGRASAWAWWQSVLPGSTSRIWNLSCSFLNSSCFYLPYNEFHKVASHLLRSELKCIWLGFLSQVEGGIWPACRAHFVKYHI